MENTLPRSGLFFTADVHGMHRNILKYCKRTQFMTEEEAFLINNAKNHDELKNIKISDETLQRHDDALVNNINAVVRETDTLWVIGDFVYGVWKNYFEVVKAFRDRINSRHVCLCSGNHDFKESFPLFERVETIAEINYNKQLIVACHYPMLSWRNNERSAWHVSGHCHGRIEEFRKLHLPNDLACDVGVDCWDDKPVSFEQLQERFDKIKKVEKQNEEV